MDTFGGAGIIGPAPLYLSRRKRPHGERGQRTAVPARPGRSAGVQASMGKEVCMRKKRILAGVLCAALVVLLSLTAGPPAEAAANGKCGDKLTWTLDDAGTLTISGTGVMTAYSSGSDVPWYTVRSEIKKVVIEPGATSIGKMAFYACTSMTSVTIPDTVTSIGDSAFRYCSGLSSITLPDSVVSFGEYAFEQCTSLKSITIPRSVAAISKYSFQYCGSLESIIMPRSVVRIVNYAFRYCSGLKDVYYTGTETQWKNMTIESYNEFLKNAEIHYEYVLPVAEGVFRIDSLVVSDRDGNSLSTIPDRDFLVTLSLHNETSSESPLIFLAAYAADGQYQGLMYVTVNAPPGGEMKITLPVDNEGGKIAELKAFAVTSFTDLKPLCEAVTFPAK